jgi:hypothetical protein
MARHIRIIYPNFIFQENEELLHDFPSGDFGLCSQGRTEIDVPMDINCIILVEHMFSG